MGTYPAGVPATDDNFIIGELYKANNAHEFSWAIGQLDDYEGVTVESDEEQLYRREVAAVDFGGVMSQAWVYWFNGDITGKPAVESGDMMEYLNKKNTK